MEKLIILGIIILAFLTSCNNEKDPYKNSTVIAKEITYELDFNKDENRPQWLNKLKREKLVDILFDKVLSGEWTAYTYFYNQPISKQELVNLCSLQVDTVSYLDTNGDTLQKVIETKFDRDEIKYMMFKEEWYFDENDFCMQKKVVMMAPIREFYIEGSNKPYKQVLFMVYFDDKHIPAPVAEN